MSDFFTLFELPQNLAIDLRDLHARYRRLQNQYHPDNATQSDVLTQTHALQKSTTINDAYQTLKDPLKRALYLCQINNVKLPERDIPISILQTQMEWREALDEASADALPALITQLDQEYVNLMSTAHTCAENKDWLALMQVIMEWQFVEKVRQSAAERSN